MVSTQGFNALLKLVEEPPEHLRFIFATTEPEKVIATIRSRTHHYPFRLIPPRLMSSYLSDLCAKEDVKVEPAALPAGRACRRRVGPRLPVGARPADRRCRPGRGHLRARVRAAGLHPRHPARRGGRRLRGSRRRGGVRRGRQGDRDRPGPASLHRGPAPPAPRPRDRRRRAGRDRFRPHRRLRGPGRTPRRPGRPLRCHRPEPRRRHPGDRAHRDARRHRTAAAAGAALRAGAAARRRPHHAGARRPPRPARAAGLHLGYAERGASYRARATCPGPSGGLDQQPGPRTRARAELRQPRRRPRRSRTTFPSRPRSPHPSRPRPAPRPRQAACRWSTCAASGPMSSSPPRPAAGWRGST